MLKAKIIILDDIIEEQVTVEINGMQLTCFAEILPYDLTVGQTYPVNLYFTFFDEPKLIEIDHGQYGAQKYNDQYDYVLSGKVTENCLSIGSNIKIEDPIFLEYTFLAEKFVQLVVDRIGIEFL